MLSGRRQKEKYKGETHGKSKNKTNEQIKTQIQRTDWWFAKMTGMGDEQLGEGGRELCTWRYISQVWGCQDSPVIMVTNTAEHT